MKEKLNLETYIDSLLKKLSGDFAKNAPEKIVEAEREKLYEATNKLTGIDTQLGLFN